MDIVIEKGVGVGRKTRGPGRWQKILLRLDVGDSFIIDESNDPKLQQLRSIRQAAKSIDYKIESAREDGSKRRIARVD